MRQTPSCRFTKSVNTGADIKRSARSGPVKPLGFLAATHIEAKRLAVLKFAPKEAYINELMDGRLYMNAAGYYHGLAGEQGDPLEASLAIPLTSKGRRSPTHYTPWPAEQASWQHHRKIPQRNIRLYPCQCTQQKEKTRTRAFPQPH